MTVTFVGTKRFKVLRKLGEGGMGSVYECQDLVDGSRVALKTLLFASASLLLRFKDEFRQFQGIHHLNLVSLGELFEEDGIWHFSMELVRGSDFLAYVRRGTVRPVSVATSAPTVTVPRPSGVAVGRRGVSLNAEALRSGLAQLARGLIALHEAGKVHRDVKPSNILVTEEGRVVLLDFGIGMDVSRPEQLGAAQLVGTPHYMAPEQAASLPVSAAADWYAVGAMTYEALSGNLPHEGTLLQVLEEKQWRVPRDVREHDPTLPDDLADLAMALLHAVPEERPSGREILRRLGVRDSGNAAALRSSIPHTDTHATPFVGRERELASLQACLRRVGERREAVAVYVHGESGIGKSALVARFAEVVKMRDPDAVLLAGSCYEHEAVPYKALDGVVDALSHYLARLPEVAAAALLPRHAPALAQAFPVLNRVEAFAECPKPVGDVDPLVLRSRVFAALRELLARIADRGCLVVCIDDLQWGDADSLALLGEILRPPDSPALLLLATVRVDEGEERWSLPTGPVALPAGGTTLRLSKLPDDHARELVDSLRRKVGGAPSVDVDAIVREAGGYPLFLQELVRYRASSEGDPHEPIALDDALWARVEALDEPARRLVYVTALSPAAVMQGMATRAAGIEGADALRHLKHLKAAHLVRTMGGTRATDLVEPYHGRVREAVRARLLPETRRSLHRRLALTMETSSLPQEYEVLAIHWREAGEPERAAESARRAAVRAEEALAFDRAVDYYRMVDERVALAPKPRRELLVRLGDALANAGRSQEAAQVFRQAATGATPREERELARRAAEHLLRSGHIDEGLTELRRVLLAVNVPYPQTTRAAIASLAWSKAKLALRGLGFRPADEASVAPEQLARIDACWAAATGLFVVDQLRGVDFQFRHLVLALQAGEPTRVIRGLGFHAIATVAMGHRHFDEAQRILALARKLAERDGTPYTEAFLSLTDSITRYLTGDWQSAVESGRVAIQLLRSNCRGVAWELATARQNVFWSLALIGSLEELRRLAFGALRETLEAGDHYAAMSIRSGLPNVVWLAMDNPGAARREADAAIAAWTHETALLQHLMDLLAQVGIDLYEGLGIAAFERVARARKRYEDAGLSRVEFNRIQLLDVAARAALGAAAEARGPDRKPYLEAARRDAALLGQERAPWARALGAAKTAGIMKLAGERDAGAAAARAFDVLEAAHLGVYATSIAVSTRLEVATAARFERERVVSPAHLARVFFPGW